MQEAVGESQVGYQTQTKQRTAPGETTSGTITVGREAFIKIRDKTLPKGDVLALMSSTDRVAILDAARRLYLRLCGLGAGCLALITGAGSGIGAATAHVFCQEGASVFLVDADAQGLEHRQRGEHDHQESLQPRGAGERVPLLGGDAIDQRRHQHKGLAPPAAVAEPAAGQAGQHHQQRQPDLRQLPL